MSKDKFQEFVPYEQALALKELGFDEPCFGFWNENKEFTSIEFDVYSGGNLFDLIKNHNNDVDTNAPTFSQAFRFFREKYDVYHFVTREVGINTSDIFFVASYYKGKKGNSPKDTCISSKTYEEAEFECLKKLIEIVKSQKTKSIT